MVGFNNPSQSLPESHLSSVEVGQALEAPHESIEAPLEVKHVPNEAWHVVVSTGWSQKNHLGLFVCEVWRKITTKKKIETSKH